MTKIEYKTKIERLQELFEQKMYLENLEFDYVSETQLNKGLKKVRKEIQEKLEELNKMEQEK